MAVQGLDISSCQASVDFKKVKAAGYEYVILRINEWNRVTRDIMKDTKFEEYYKAAKAAGLKVGAYYFTYANTIKCVSESVRERYACWIAEWSSKCNYKGSYGMWQNGTAMVSGISGAVDHDICYVDYPTQIKAKGLNGFQKPSTLPTLDTGSCYKLNETTVGALAVKSLLKLAYAKKMHTVKVTDTKTYDQSAFDAVGALQKAWGYKVTGRAGENFVRMLTNKLK